MCWVTGPPDAATSSALAGSGPASPLCQGQRGTSHVFGEVRKINNVSEINTPPEKCETESVCRFPPPAGLGETGAPNGSPSSYHCPEARAGGTGGWELAPGSPASVTRHRNAGPGPSRFLTAASPSWGRDLWAQPWLASATLSPGSSWWQCGVGADDDNSHFRHTQCSSQLISCVEGGHS